MAENWDTETAKDCRFPELQPDACQKCRDQDYCAAQRQISIFDILREKEQDPVDPKDWRPIRSGSKIGLTSYMPLVYPVTDHDTSESAIECVTFGRVDDMPAVIGCRIWISNGIEEYEPIQYKPMNRRQINGRT